MKFFIALLWILLATSAAANSYNEQRQAFETKLLPHENYGGDKISNPTKKSLWIKTFYNSALGKNAVLILKQKNLDKNLPVLIYARGGHGGLGDAEFIYDNEHEFLQEATKAAQKGELILIVPTWRGDNTNPGRAEMFLGEVDDALNLLAFVQQMENVDTKRIYMAGHSTGGTLTSLTAIASEGKLRAAFSFGGVMDMTYRTLDGDYSYAPFDMTNPKEDYIRSPIHFIDDLQTPLFLFAGSKEYTYCYMGEHAEQKARFTGKPVLSYCVQDANHSDYVAQFMDLTVEKILNDTKESLNINFENMRKQYFSDWK